MEVRPPDQVRVTRGERASRLASAAGSAAGVPLPLGCPAAGSDRLLKIRAACMET